MAYEFRGQTLAKTQGQGGRRSKQPKAPRQSRAPRSSSGSGDGRSLMRVFAAVVGLVFLLLGVGGFIPGVTENVDQLTAYGTDSNAELLGLFRVSVAHNIVHLLFGIGLVAAASYGASRLYLLLGGVANLGVAAYGFLVDEFSDANVLPVNDADNLLHVGLSVGMILLGLIGVAVAQRAAARSA